MGNRDRGEGEKELLLLIGFRGRAIIPPNGIISSFAVAVRDLRQYVIQRADDPSPLIAKAQSIASARVITCTASRPIGVFDI